jgi:hypothetical protein
VLVSVRLAVQCHCVPVNSDVRRHRASGSVVRRRTLSARLRVITFASLSTLPSCVQVSRVFIGSAQVARRWRLALHHSAAGASYRSAAIAPNRSRVWHAVNHCIALLHCHRVGAIVLWMFSRVVPSNYSSNATVVGCRNFLPPRAAR